MLHLNYSNLSFLPLDGIISSWQQFDYILEDIQKHKIYAHETWAKKYLTA